MNKSTPALKVENLSVQFESFSLKKISFEVAKGEYFVILGLSGAGKTLILEAISGLINTEEGEIFLNGSRITQKSIGDRKVGLMFQDYAIFPHLSVYSNISYPLKSMALGKQEILDKVMELSSEAGISHLLKRKPGTLSGGELQRVALCRILAYDPDVLLLDEPMSAMDVSKKNDFQTFLKEINRKGKTIVHITHDFHEAISLAHRIAVVEDGSLVQLGTPEEVFKNPASHFVATLSGVKNFFKAKSVGNHRVLLAHDIYLTVSESFSVGEGFVMIRSDEIVLSESLMESSMTNNLQGTVTGFYFSPGGYEVQVDVGFVITARITDVSFDRLNIFHGKSLHVSFKASAVKFNG